MNAGEQMVLADSLAASKEIHMRRNDRATIKQIDGRELGPVDMPEMLTVGDVAEKFNCSARHVYRLVKRKRMPAPVKIGTLNRWSLTTIENWVADGCPAVKELATRAASPKGGRHECN